MTLQVERRRPNRPLFHSQLSFSARIALKQKNARLTVDSDDLIHILGEIDDES